ncbi:MAG: hypothetical protein AAGM16_03995 [Pseudomonadota bacterium]
METRANWLALLEVTGEDAESFLQGQLTQDLRRLTPDAPVLFAASCDAKGRVLAVLTLIRQDSTLYIALRDDRVEPWLEHVLRFRLRARVDLTRSSSHRVVATRPAPAWGPLSDAPYPGSPEAISWQIGDLGETILPIDAPDPKGLVADAQWRQARIAAGIADVGPAAAGSYTPHMLSLDRIGAISFSKGCYTGQEVVARTEHLGKVKRRVQHIKVASGSLEEGAELMLDGRAASRVAVASGNAGLAVLAEAGDAALSLTDDRAVTRAA